MSSHIVLVTGANRGIGFSIIQATALRYPTSTYILACRSRSSGQAAISELRKLGVTTPLDVVELDITNDDSIISAAEIVKQKYGHVDVLVNNAGVGIIPKSQALPDLRRNFSETFNTNITSVLLTTNSFLPLLHTSPCPKVINISSGRTSLTHSSVRDLPTTTLISYSMSKTALNSLTIEMQKTEDGREERGKVEFFAVNPGHCKTAFNGFKGTRDPIEGVEVVVQLVGAERGKWKSRGFWE